jgi:hypothetical protein
MPKILSKPSWDVARREHRYSETLMACATGGYLFWKFKQLLLIAQIRA